MLKQLWHVWDTQKNEAMNTSVAALAPKNKTYSMSDSLATRVAIATGYQVNWFTKFQSICIELLGFTIDEYFLLVLHTRDNIKKRKNVMSSSKEGKIARSTNKYAKFNNVWQKQRNSHKVRLGYQTGIATSAAKKNLPTAKGCNPKGTPKHLL